MPVKVLHLIKTLGLGGAETNLLNLIRTFDARSIESHVAYSRGGEVEDRFVRAGAKLFKYASQDHKIKSAATLGIVGRLASYIRKQDIRIVHTHNFNAHVWGLLAAKLSGAKLIEHVHDFRYLDPREYMRRHGNVAQYRTIRYFKGRSDRVVVLTKQNREFLLSNRFYPAERVLEIRNGIPLTAARSPVPGLKERFRLSADSLVVLTPARMAEEKNIGLIVDIARDVISHCPEARFVIAGDGPLLEEMKRRVDSKGLEEYVRFIGYFDDIESLLPLTDVFLLPSFLELHSIAILEAMKAGVPVVVSRDVGCNSEFIEDGSNGMLRDPFTREGWAGALVALLKDETARKAMGERGREYCRRHFDIQDTAARFKKLYAELAG